LAEALISVDTSLVLVEDAMTPEAYSVAPNAPLSEVVSELAKHKYGSAVVVENDKVVGIFTLVDVCIAFAELLHGRLAG
jgi:acetoin utilization protein AcuB